MNIAEFMQVMEGIAPQETAEPWDNPGLLAGDPKADEYISELDTYCALDTFALYKIYQKLCAASGLPAPSEDGAKSGAVCSADGAKSAEEAEIGTATGGKTGIGGKKDKKRFPFPFFLFRSRRNKANTETEEQQ